MKYICNSNKCKTEIKTSNKIIIDGISCPICRRPVRPVETETKNTSYDK